MYGKMTYKGKELIACCARPNLADAYIMNRLFPAVICKNCGEVTGVFGNIKIWIFTIFFQPFWDGRVWVVKEQVTDKDMKRIKEFS